MSLNIKFASVVEASRLVRTAIKELGSNDPISIRAFELLQEMWIDFKIERLSAIIRVAPLISYEKLEFMRREMDKYKSIYKLLKLKIRAVFISSLMGDA